MYAVVSDRVAPGRGRKGPTPGHRFCRKRKKRCRVQRTQHRLNKSERNTIGPTSPFPPLKKGGCLGIIRLRCSRETVVLSGTVTHHRGIAGSQPAIPCRFNCVSRYILPHAVWKIKWFPVLAARYSSRSFGSSYINTPALAETANFEAWGPLFLQGRNTWGCVPAGVSLALPGDFDFKTPGAENGAVGDPAYLIYYMYHEI